MQPIEPTMPRYIAAVLLTLLTLLTVPPPVLSIEDTGAWNPISPRVERLAVEIERDPEAIERFWAEVRQHGTPLIEPADSPDERYVTFLWRDDGQTRNVAIFSGVTMMWGFTAADLAEQQMKRLADTDVWYRTHRFPSDTRFAYYLSPNDSLIPSAEVAGYEQWERRSATWQHDPLNPLRQVRPHGDREWVISIGELPDAPPKPWETFTPAGEGDLDEHAIQSKVLGTSRRFWIYRPSGVEGVADHPLLVVFDGSPGSLTREPGSLARVVDYLHEKGRIEAPLIVSIEQKDRGEELACSDAWNRFLVTEVLPFVRSRYRVTSDPRRVVIAGGSLGGLAALYGALKHPEVFGNVLSTSGFVSWKSDSDYGWIMRQYAAAPKLPLRFYLDVGIFERDADMLLYANRHLRDVLTAKGYEIHYDEFSGGHDSMHTSVGYARGLQKLLFEPVREEGAFQILFDSDRSGRAQIHLMDADGTNVRQLSVAGRAEWSMRFPDWSPDRRRIVFQSTERERPADLYVVDAGGGNLLQLTDTPHASEGGPAWSPDGLRIAYDRASIAEDGTRGGSHVWIVHADGSNPRALSSGESRNWYPAWSPDGSTIAFASDRDGDLDLYLMNPDGSNVRQLTDAEGADAGPSWSPDGKHIAFDSTRDGNWELYVMAADGSDVRRLTHTPNRSEARPTWSPDGRRISFNAGTEGNPGSYEICVMDTDGSNERCLTSNHWFDAHPDWS
ncbi:MAG TPA: alpha/beta hydrolase-fold protein [Thermoanaerobaculia bacterium]|nr:alpha/beta hydrolase-fold protein [Thermoanaerobaculia bacterium]